MKAFRLSRPVENVCKLNSYESFQAFTAGILDTVQDFNVVPKARRKVLLVSSEQRVQVAAEMLVRRKCVVNRKFARIVVYQR